MIENESQPAIRPIVIFTILFVVGSWVFTYCTLKDLLFQNRSSFGDMFGGLNALYSGLAFAGIIYTILLQREELKLQRQELKDTRSELERTANAQEKSQEALNNQLKSMELSSKIDNLFKFIELEKGEEEKYAAQQIIKDLTKKIFHLDEHAELLRPSLISRTLPLKTKTNSEASTQFKMALGPAYLSLKILDIKIDGEIESWIHNPQSNLGKTLNGSSTIQIEFKSRESFFNFRFKYSSPITNRIYIQEIRYYVDETNRLIEVIGTGIREVES